MWPVTPTAGHLCWIKESSIWLDRHKTLVEAAQANKDADIVLLGDGIIQQLGSPLDKKPLCDAWQKQFQKFKTLNLGIGGERTENLLWRLEHGALDGLAPKAIVLMIGVNNTRWMSCSAVPAESVAQGIKLCVDNIRARFPTSYVVLVKILPATRGGEGILENIKKVNAPLEQMKLDKDPKVKVLDIWNDFTNQDGSLKNDAYLYARLCLSDAGNQVFSAKLKTVMEQLIK